MRQKLIIGLSIAVVLFVGFITTYTFSLKLKEGAVPSSSLTASVAEALQLQLNVGWSRFSPQGGQNVIYVSSSQGNDNNDGLSQLTPVKTLAKGQSLIRSNHSDWMVLRRGDVWDESFGTWTRSGTSADNPVVISSYGTGPRPLVNVRNGQSALALRNAGVNNFAMIGIHIRSYQEKNKKQEKGISLPGNYQNIYLDDMFIEGFTGNVVTETCETCVRKNLVITHSIIANAYNPEGNASGIFITSTDGIKVEDSIFYHNGWNNGNVSYDPTARRTAATEFNQGLYLSHNNTANTIVRNNVIADTANGGVWLRRGGLAENNFFVRNTNALLVAIGPNTVRNNVIVEGVNNIDGNKVGGIETKPTNTGTVFENNLIVNSAKNTGSGFKAVGSFDFGYGEDYAKSLITRYSFTFKNNTIYNAGVGLNVGTRSIAGGDILGNIFIEKRDQAPVPTGYAPVGACSDLGGGGLHLTVAGNTFYCPNSTNKFVITNVPKTFSEYSTAVGDTTNREADVTFADPNRSINNYVSGGYDAFVRGLLNQSIDRWDEKFSAASLNTYFREAFKTKSKTDNPKEPDGTTTPPTKPSSITLLTPNGGETISIGDTVNVTWKSTELPADSTVRISLYKGVELVSTLATVTNSGSYSWQVGERPEGFDYSIRVTSTKSDMLKDNSDRPFMINKLAPPETKITVTSPNGNENVTVGSTVNITWSSLTFDKDAHVRISLYKAGVQVSTIVADTYNYGTYTWTVGDRETASDYKIRITSISKPTVYDESDLVFTITKPLPPSITVQSPNGGEAWSIGDAVQIRWSTVSLPSTATVRISLYKAGVQVSTLVDSYANVGVFNWNIADRPTGSDYTVRVTSTSDTTIKDESNATFTINPAPQPSITVTSPNGGETIKIGSTVPISWTSTRVSNNVRISLYKNGTYVKTIASDVANNGSYSWTVGSETATSGYAIRVTSSADDQLRDMSNGTFTITK